LLRHFTAEAEAEAAASPRQQGLRSRSKCRVPFATLSQQFTKTWRRRSGRGLLCHWHRRLHLNGFARRDSHSLRNAEWTDRCPEVRTAVRSQSSLHWVKTLMMGDFLCKPIGTIVPGSVPTSPLPLQGVVRRHALPQRHQIWTCLDQAILHISTLAFSSPA
jgi:hypothetical protein